MKDLTSDEVKKLLFNRGIGKCSICRSQSFGLDYLFLPAVNNGLIVDNDRGAIVLQISCDGCGYVTLHDAVKIGFIDPSESNKIQKQNIVISGSKPELSNPDEN